MLDPPDKEFCKQAALSGALSCLKKVAGRPQRAAARAAVSARAIWLQFWFSAALQALTLLPNGK